MNSRTQSICSLMALSALSVLGWPLGARAQGSSVYYYVANTQPPDAYLAMRSAPSGASGQRIEEMPNGTPLEILEKRSDGWWLVRDVRTGRQGWALSGTPTRRWIVCCASAESEASGPQSELARGFRMPSNNISASILANIRMKPPLQLYDATSLATKGSFPVRLIAISTGETPLR
jgi:hypothetical protein